MNAAVRDELDMVKYLSEMKADVNCISKVRTV